MEFKFGVANDIFKAASFMFMFKNKESKNKKSKLNNTNNFNKPTGNENGNKNNNFIFLLIFLFILFINSSWLEKFSPTAHEFNIYLKIDGIRWVSYPLILWLTCSLLFELFEIILFILLAFRAYSVPNNLPRFVFNWIKELDNKSKLGMNDLVIRMYFTSFISGLVLFFLTILLCYLFGAL